MWTFDPIQNPDGTPSDEVMATEHLDLSEFRRQIARIPEISTVDAQALVRRLDREIRRKAKP